MKFKRIIAGAFLICFCLISSGCDGSMKDLNKQLKKMESLQNDDDIFEDEYKVVLTSGESEETSLKKTLKKDDDTIYLSILSGESETKIWVGEKGDDRYFVFYDDGEKKQYQELTEKEAETLIKKLETSNLDLVEIYDDLAGEIKDVKETCGNDNVACKISKNIWGNKVTFNYENKDTSYLLKSVIKRGRFESVKTTQVNGNEKKVVNLSFDYGNQTVKMPSTSDYVETNDLIATL